MADPVLPDIYRAQVRVPGKSGLPHDVFVNTFAFRNDQIAPAAVGGIIATVLTAFYGFFEEFLSGTQAVWSETELRVYDLGQEPPRVPEILEMPLAVTGGGTPYPGEVAACLSFYATRNLPRSRGRVYIGPLKTTASSISVDRVIPAEPFRQAMLDGGANMITTTEDVSWVLISQADQAAKEVTHLWVDNAYDTQRRRGIEPTERLVWPPIV